jgi:pyruvate kinase
MIARQAQGIAERLIPQLVELRDRAIALEQAHASELQEMDLAYQPSARNLLHYLAVRQLDLRPLQRNLVSLGLSSLGASESHILSTIEAILYALHELAGRTVDLEPAVVPHVDSHTGPMLLDRNTEHLLGLPSGKRTVRIMVTMPSEAATDPDLVRDLLAAGMDVMRINCAHDDQTAWMAMIDNLRQASREIGRTCKIYADLAGPKLRTGAIAPAGRIVRLRPKRNHRGEVVTPGRIWLAPDDLPAPVPPSADYVVPVGPAFLGQVRPGDEVRLTDCRGRRRRLTVGEVPGAAHTPGCLLLTDRTAYVETGMPIHLYRSREWVADGSIGLLPELVLPIQLKTGDTLVLTKSDLPGQPARRDDQGKLVEPAHIACTLKEAFAMVKPGERVRLDDAKIEGTVIESDGERIVLRITHTGLRGGKLRAEKGINFPDSELNLSALTPKDIQDLGFLVEHVDVLGLSFVRSAKDVRLLEGQLERLGASHLGIVLKIENRRAFENLPHLLLASLRSPPDGVMVARGDLAAEVGFARLAEVQQEILWLCEAAHMPVIWATQVLENLAQRGSPSRAEITDVVTSSQTECVMLNKGPYILRTVDLLSGILERMEQHQTKRRTMMRPLSISYI